MRLKNLEKLLREFDFPEESIPRFLKRYDYLEKIDFYEVNKEFFNATAEDLNSTYRCSSENKDNE